ncbi:hypothetical protein Aperf_G00000131894 [Anoplocephala perfoliata]
MAKSHRKDQSPSNNEKPSPARPEPKGSRSASSDSSSSSAPPSIYLVATPIPADACGIVIKSSALEEKSGDKFQSSSSSSSSTSSSSERNRTRKGKEKDSSSSSISSSSSSSDVPPDGHTRVASKSPIVVFQVEPAGFETKSKKKCKGRGDGRKKGGELISPAPQGSPPLPHQHQEFDGDQHQRKRKSWSPCVGGRNWGPLGSPPRGPPPQHHQFEGKRWSRGPWIRDGSPQFPPGPPPHCRPHPYPPQYHQGFGCPYQQRWRSRSPGAGRRDWGPPRSPPRGPPPGSPPPHHYPHPHPYHCHREFARHQQQQIRPKSMYEQSATEFETCTHIECGEVSDTNDCQSSIVIRRVCKKCQRNLDKGKSLVRRRSISNTSALKGRQDKSRRQTPSPGPSFQPTSGLPQPEARWGKRNKPPKPLGEDEQMFIGSGSIYANKAFMKCYQNNLKFPTDDNNKGEKIFVVRSFSELSKGKKKSKKSGR